MAWSPYQRESCSANVEDPELRAGPPDPADHGQGDKPALIPLVPRTARTVGLAVGERSDGADSTPPRRRPPRSAHRPPLGALDRQAGGPRPYSPSHAAGSVHHGGTRRRDYPSETCSSPCRLADAHVYDRHRTSFDKHVAYARMRRRLHRRSDCAFPRHVAQALLPRRATVDAFGTRMGSGRRTVASCCVCSQ